MSMMQGSLRKCWGWITVLAVLASSVAQAQQALNIDLSIGGTSAGHWAPQIIDIGGGDYKIYDITYNVPGTSLTFSNVSLDFDPFISASVDVVNNTAVTQNYTLTFTLPIIAVISPGSLMGGSTQGGVTDANFNGVGIVSTVGPGSALFYGQIDGLNVLPLFSHLSTFTAPFAGGSASGSASAGLPGPTIPGPNPLLSIGIKHEFSLTPGDRATFTSFFVVNPEPIPEPASLTLLGIGGLLVLFRRSRQTATR